MELESNDGDKNKKVKAKRVCEIPTLARQELDGKASNNHTETIERHNATSTQPTRNEQEIELEIFFPTLFLLSNLIVRGLVGLRL